MYGIPINETIVMQISIDIEFLNVYKMYIDFDLETITIINYFTIYYL